MSELEQIVEDVQREHRQRLKILRRKPVRHRANTALLAEIAASSAERETLQKILQETAAKS